MERIEFYGHINIEREHADSKLCVHSSRLVKLPDQAIGVFTETKSNSGGHNRASQSKQKEKPVLKAGRDSEHRHPSRLSGDNHTTLRKLEQNTDRQSGKDVARLFSLLDEEERSVMMRPGGTDLAAPVHLRRWIERNRTTAVRLREQFDLELIVHNAESSERIARWAYSQAAAASGMAWLRRREFQRIDESCLNLFV